MKNYKINGACSMNWVEEMCTSLDWKNHKRKEHSRDLGIDGNKIKVRLLLCLTTTP
jgi:hypothetical protein